eukprot:m.13137 g.13137  ORF g.13137 m.13137 type:complete len:538 (+) comp4796_c0_seq1:180-1793(+)
MDIQEKKPLLREHVQYEGTVSGSGEVTKQTAPVTVAGTLMAMVPLMASFEFGFALMFTSPLARVINGTVDGTVLMNNVTDGGLGMTESESDLFASSACLGAMAGALLGSWLLALIGRKASLMLCCLPYIGGGILQATAYTFGPFLAGRILVGLGIGLSSVAVPMYIAEVAPDKVRGVLGTAHQLNIVFGVLVGAAVGIPWAGQWRTLSWAVIPVPCLLFLCCFLIPRSPRWLVGKGKIKEARSALMKLRGNHTAIVEEELIELKGSVGNQDGEDEGNGAQESSSVFVPTVLIVVSFIFQQFSGVAAMIFFGGMIFRMAGITDNNLGATIAQSIQFLFTAVSVVLVDRLGRRPLLLISCICMSTSLSMLGLFFYTYDDDGWPEEATLPAEFALAMTLLFFIGFSIGLGGLPWLLMSELAPPRYSGLISGGGSLVNWLCAFIVTESFNPMIKAVGNAVAFWIFGGIVTCGIVFFALCIPETKGQTLANIQRYFQGKYKLDATPQREKNMVYASLVVGIITVGSTVAWVLIKKHTSTSTL